jgi:hypothetical protein
MADTPDTDPSYPLTELSFLNQPSEEQERDPSISTDQSDLPNARVATAESDQKPPCARLYARIFIYHNFFAASESSASQLTSSDKLSDLPALLRSSPASRSAIAPRTNHSSSEGQDLPSTLARFPRDSVPRAPPISHSQSDSAAEGGTPSRQRVSFDSERESSTSPRTSRYLTVFGP